MSFFHSLISISISKVRGEEFLINDSLSFPEIFEFSIEKVIELARGLITFRKVCFIGRNVRIKSKSKFKHLGVFKIGDYCNLFATSKNGILLGKNFSLGRLSAIECNGSLRSLGFGFSAGDNVGIGSYSFIGAAGGVSIGSNTITGNYISLHSENHTDTSGLFRTSPTTRIGIVIGQNCWIGAKSTILDGVTIEDNVIIGAGSVVTKGHYKSGCVYAGVPAKLIAKD